jgi:hypothetical protein
MVTPAVVEGVAGAAAGMAALTTTYPLMTISTLQATRSKRKERDLRPHIWGGTMADIADV